MRTGFGRRIDWAANLNWHPTEWDDYCFPMHDKLGGRLGPEFDEDLGGPRAGLGYDERTAAQADG